MISQKRWSIVRRLSFSFLSCTKLIPNFNYISLILLISTSASIRPYTANKTTTDFLHAGLHISYGRPDPHWNLRYSNCYIFAENYSSSYLRSICSIRTRKVTKAIKPLATSSTPATFFNPRRGKSQVLGGENGTLWNFGSSERYKLMKIQITRLNIPQH